MLLEEALRSYVLQLEADGRSAHTIAQYERHVRALGRWLAARGDAGNVEGIGHEDLARFLVSDETRLRADGRPKKATAMNALRSSLRTFFAWCADAGIVDRNPARLIRRARCGTPPPRGLSDDEQARLVAALDDTDGEAAARDRVLFGLLLGVGLRIGSALALDVEDVDLDAAELTLQRCKFNRCERAILCPRAVELLRPLVAARGAGPLFVSRHGTRLTARQAQRRLEVAAARAGIGRRISPHRLRHSFATALYRRTGDLLLTQAALGHRSIASTIAYAACSADRLRAALAG